MALSSSRPVLTLAIPTYNRANFLDRALSSIQIQLAGKDLPIELIVSDNCSTDNTKLIVESYIKKGLNIRYIKNHVNKGADFNVAQCYNEARGRYVVAFGDDDYLLNGSLEQIIRLLTMDNFGVVFLSSNNYTSDTSSLISEQIDYNVCGSMEFISKVNYYLTFISGNIINTAFIDKDILWKNLGSGMNHLSQIIQCALSSTQSVFVNTIFLAAEPDNSGGYDPFEVFGNNLNLILHGLIPQHGDSTIKKVKQLINNGLLRDYFPIYILKFRSKALKGFEVTNIKGTLYETFKSYSNYWLYCYPLIHLYLFPAKVYYILFSRLLRIKKLFVALFS